MQCIPALSDQSECAHLLEQLNVIWSTYRVQRGDSIFVRLFRLEIEFTWRCRVRERPWFSSAATERFARLAQPLTARCRHHKTRHAMIRILGSARQLCDGWTRREMLTAGGLSLFGL